MAQEKTKIMVALTILGPVIFQVKKSAPNTWFQPCFLGSELERNTVTLQTATSFFKDDLCPAFNKHTVTTQYEAADDLKLVYLETVARWAADRLKEKMKKQNAEMAKTKDHLRVVHAGGNRCPFDLRFGVDTDASDVGDVCEDCDVWKECLAANQAKKNGDIVEYADVTAMGDKTKRKVPTGIVPGDEGLPK